MRVLDQVIQLVVCFMGNSASYMTHIFYHATKERDTSSQTIILMYIENIRAIASW